MSFKASSKHPQSMKKCTCRCAGGGTWRMMLLGALPCFMPTRYLPSRDCLGVLPPRFKGQPSCSSDRNTVCLATPSAHTPDLLACPPMLLLQLQKYLCGLCQTFFVYCDLCDLWKIIAEAEPKCLNLPLVSRLYLNCPGFEMAPCCLSFIPRRREKKIRNRTKQSKTKLD